MHIPTSKYFDLGFQKSTKISGNSVTEPPQWKPHTLLYCIPIPKKTWPRLCISLAVAAGRGGGQMSRGRREASAPGRHCAGGRHLEDQNMEFRNLAASGEVISIALRNYTPT